MSEKKKVPGAWKKSEKSIRAVQVAFELEQMQSKALRIKAIENNLSPSDYIRDIIDLPRKKPIRPRLSISLSEEDYEILGRRYKLKSTEKDKIRARIKEELVAASKKQLRDYGG